MYQSNLFSGHDSVVLNALVAETGTEGQKILGILIRFESNYALTRAFIGNTSTLVLSLRNRNELYYNHKVFLNFKCMFFPNIF